ncbi:substrate-binding domain-containing protein [Acidisoma sp. S159]|uniref:substrate-binding domain-containing protein n=1 Tax=Acidisoma sp. S159 TaxID=1747225 RepID=UPI00131DCB48|nr:substrate-binding domain-containing protein [Acidisoma sp. S159]
MSLLHRATRLIGLTILVTISGVVGVAVSGKAADLKPITIALIQKQGDQQYFVDEAEGARKEAKALGNIRLDVINVSLDSNAAISAMSTMLGQKVDGIAIVVPDQQIGPQVIDMAAQANVPLIAVDDPIKSGAGKSSAYVGFDNYQMGYKVGLEAGRLFKDAGWTPANTRILAAFKQDVSDCRIRQQGQMTGFTKSAGGTLALIEIGTDNSNVDAQNRTAATVTAHPDVKHWVVWGCNDESETGGVTALANAGFRPEQIIGVGLGAYLTCKDWQAGSPTGNKAALFLSGSVNGAAAVRVLNDNIRNKIPLPPMTIANQTIATPQNWKSVMGSCS